MQCVTIDTNISNRASSQYTGFNFNSMVKFGGKFLGANENGLFELGLDDDNGVGVDAEFELVKSDFGIPNNKRVRKFYFGVCCDGDLEIALVADNKEIRTLSVPATGEGVQRIRVKAGRKDKGRYFSFRVKNTNGCNFSVYSMETLLVILHNGRS